MKVVSFVFAIVCVVLVPAQNPTRIFERIAETPTGCRIEVSDGTYMISSYSDFIFECVFVPKGHSYDSTSHVISLKASTGMMQLNRQDTGNYLLKRGEAAVMIQISPFQLSYYYKGKLVSSEAMGFQQKETPQLQFHLEAQEKLMGGGARALGMDRRGYRLQLYNRAHYGYETHSELMNFTMPIVLSDKCYALHFDNPQIGWLDLDSKKENKLTYEVIGGPLRYQVIFSDDWKGLSSSLTALLGRQPMPARWTLGNFASRFGYHSASEAANVVSEFRNQQIPLDAIIFDLYWFGKDIQGTLGNFEFYKDSFPDAQNMIAEFRNQDVKTVLITEPFVLTTSKKWQEAERLKILATDTLGKAYRYDFYFGNTGLIDLYNPASRTWFWDIYKDLHGYGVAGFWGDLGEPEVHPTKLKHGSKWADEVHNIYGHDWARLLYDGYRTTYPTERPFILMRAGYSGSQQFGMVPWSGDVNRTWGGLKPQMEISLQMGLQGMAYMHSDLGGFAGANNDPELYVRWLQYGVFQPVFRPHAQQEVASEAIFKDEKTKALAKAAIELRYQLLPYNYSIAYENHQTGVPLMRPLFMEFPKASWSFDQTDAYMWGPFIYVHAITDSMRSTPENTIQTQLPTETNWFDFYSGKFVGPSTTKNPEGFRNMTSQKTLDQLPVYVRAGAFIPMSPIIQSTEKYRDTAVVLHVYAAPNSESTVFDWYEDDGLTFGADTLGLSKLLHCTAKQDNTETKLSFQASAGTKIWDPAFHFILVVHCAEAPSKLYVNDEKTKFTYDKKTQLLRLKGNPKIQVSTSAQSVRFVW
ncbi:MAG: hypothetical protein RLZZ301_1712 [Bacteroidota bacterium]|jgi:alpha-glucosidase (family GH31 glycosyl hydrolase)